MVTKGILIVLLTGGVGLLAYHYGHRPPPVFQTVPVERGDIQAIVNSTGTLSALVTVQVGCQVSGIITKLYADFNSQVRKDQLLAEIDPEPFIAKLNQAKATLDSSKAAVDAANAGVKKALADLQTAKLQEANQKSQMELAASAESFAKLQADRAAKSAKAEVGTVSDQDAAQAALQVAADTEESAEAQKQVADVSIDVSQAAYQSALTQVTIANAQVRQAQSVVEQAQLDVDHTKIFSPTDGVVLARQVDIGQTVAASFSAPNLFQIAQDLTQMQVDADIDESDISKISVGEGATFVVDALPGVTFPTKVLQVRENPINVQNVITYDAVMRVTNPDLKLFPGMTANIRLQVASQSGVLKIPSAAMRYLPPGVKPERSVQSVYTLGPGNQPVGHKVKTGISDGRFVEIVSGDLKEGDQLIVSETHPK